MARVSKKITNWLYTVLQPQYTHAEITYRDIYHFLLLYLEQGFKIRTAVYTAALGGSDLLINLYGPLSTSHNAFQVDLWVPLNYPYADATGRNTENPNGVPIVHVVPQKGHIIRPGNNVDSQGRVYHPFLVQWFNSMGVELQQSSEQFNLLLLMECLKLTFERSSPVGLAPERTGPTLPPKPSSGILLSQQSGVSLASNGPPLPQKLSPLDNQTASVPQRYRAPPPLPSQITPEHWGSATSETNMPVGGLKGEHNISPIPFPNKDRVDHNWLKDNARNPPYPHSHQEHRPDSNKHEKPSAPSNHKVGRKQPGTVTVASVSTIEDLMDQVTLESNKETTNPYELQRIAHFINMHLDSNNPDSVNSLIPKLNEMKRKASALYLQLVHRDTQAKANATNLEHHVQYLTSQVASIEQLNKLLHEISEVNKNSKDEVVLTPTGERKIPLEDLILPDLALVRQLYETVAEIEGYKDAIKLVGGNYKTELELINDETLDSCVRSVRALSRELFWLEATKNEIARVMGLQI